MKSLSSRLRSRPSIVDVDAAVALPESLRTARRANVTVGADGERPTKTFEQLLAEATALGYEEGLAAGLADARAAEERQRTEILEATARQLVDAAEIALQQREAILDEVVNDAIDLAIEVVHILLGEELARSEDPTRDAVLHALKLAPEGESFVIRVPPSSSIDPDSLLTLTNGAPISVKEDPTIAPGDCVVQVGACRIDRQLEPALDRVRLELSRLRAGEVKSVA